MGSSSPPAHGALPAEGGASKQPPASSRRPLKRENSGKNMNGSLYMQTSGNVVLVRRRIKRKDESPVKQLTRWFVENQIGMYSSRSVPARLRVS